MAISTNDIFLLDLFYIFLGVYSAHALIITLETPSLLSSKVCGRGPWQCFQAIWDEPVAIRALIDNAGLATHVSLDKPSKVLVCKRNETCELNVLLGKATKQVVGYYNIKAEGYGMNDRPKSLQFFIDVNARVEWEWQRDFAEVVNETCIRVEVKVQGYPLPEVYHLSSAEPFMFLESANGVFLIDWPTNTGKTLLVEARGRFNQSINKTIEVPAPFASSLPNVSRVSTDHGQWWWMVVAGVAGVAGVVGTVLSIVCLKKRKDGKSKPQVSHRSIPSYSCDADHNCDRAKLLGDSKGQDSKGQDSKGQDSKGQDSKGQDSKGGAALNIYLTPHVQVFLDTRTAMPCEDFHSSQDAPFAEDCTPPLPAESADDDVSSLHEHSMDAGIVGARHCSTVFSDCSVPSIRSIVATQDGFSLSLPSLQPSLKYSSNTEARIRVSPCDADNGLVRMEELKP